jgi:hypothetical protein
MDTQVQLGIFIIIFLSFWDHKIASAMAHGTPNC